jgi:Skp family chaperone for outer membrane proteins
MNRIIQTSLLATIALLIGASSVWAQSKVGTVDVQRVRKDNLEFKAALKEIDDMVADFERRRDQRQTELQQLAEDMQLAQEQNVSASVERMRSELQVKSQDFQTFMEETFGEEGIIETKSAELLEPIYAKLADAAKAVAKVQSLDIILDLEQVNPLFVSESLDVTEAVLAEMAKLR